MHVRALQGALGMFGTVLNRALKAPVEIPASYRLVKNLTPKYTSVASRVGLYLDNKDHPVIIKQANFTFLDADAMHLKNEALILKVIGRHSDLAVSPPFVKLIERPHNLTLITGVVSGVPLNQETATRRKMIAPRILRLLDRLSGQLAAKGYPDLPVRDHNVYFVSFIRNVIRAVRNDSKNFTLYLSMAAAFYRYYLRGAADGVPYSLTHRDLYPANIIYDEKKDSVTILDWESAAVSDSLYDVAQVSLIYHEDIGTAPLIAYLKDRLNTNGERYRFAGLAVFNCIQLLGNTIPGDHDHAMAKRYFTVLTGQILPALLYRKSPFEIVNTAVLSMISFFYRVTRINPVDPEKKIIMCYHSVGNDGWRFSTRTGVFKSHLKALKKHASMVSLDELLTGTNGGVHISFDDGYQSLIDTADPILREEGIPATVFVLGDPKNANRSELNNDLPIMQTSDVRKLHKNGWEIGHHTDTHANLGTLSEKELTKELKTSRRRLCRELGLPVRYFAYPRGIYNDLVLKKVKEAGFSHAFTVNGGEAVPGAGNPYAVDRVPVDGELSANQLIALISPPGLAVSALFLKLLSLKERYVSTR